MIFIIKEILLQKKLKKIVSIIIKNFLLILIENFFKKLIQIPTSFVGEKYSKKHSFVII